MKLIFKKEEENISIQIIKGATTIGFTYVDMIKELLDTNNIDEPIFEGDISEEEKERIKEMLGKISDAIVIEEEK